MVFPRLTDHAHGFIITEVHHYLSLLKITLWIAQVLLALVFVASGSMKLFAFAHYAAMAPEMANQRALVRFIGVCELAGAAGLILPALTIILPVLTTWAAVGLGTIMVLATGFHLSRGELAHAVITVVLLGLAACVVYGRGFGRPSPAHSRKQTLTTG